MVKVKKTVAILIVSILSLIAVLSLVGCREHRNPDGTGDVKIDTTKTQLYVANYNGGFGQEWLDDGIIPAFEAAYADYQGVDGKVGVQVIVDSLSLEGSRLIDAIPNQRSEIYFTERVYYRDAVASGYLMDLTDCVSEKLPGEDKSILDKMDDELVDYYNIDNKYYAIPHYTGIFGIVYDVDLFDEEMLYFAKNANNGNDGFIVSPDDEKSFGPDGKTGIIDGIDYSMDDGLPVTYDDFYRLCKRMTVDIGGIVPVSWAGQYQQYMCLLASSLQASYEGKEQMMLNYNFDGTATTLVDSIDASGNVTFAAPTAISNNNGYLLNKQAGRYYALSFIENIIKNQWYYGLSFNQAQSHTSAQEDFLYGRFSSKKDTIAMLFDGTWWENEADGIFTDMAKTNRNASRENRRFAMMPLPKAPGQANDNSTVMDYLKSACFASANVAPEKVDLIKDFIQFCSTDASLVQFTKITSAPKSFNYAVPASETSNLSYYAKSVLNLCQKSDIVYPVSDNDLFNSAMSTFDSDYRWNSTVNGNNYNIVSTAIKNNNISAKQYFEGLLTYNSKTKWETSFSKYFK